MRPQAGHGKPNKIAIGQDRVKEILSNAHVYNNTKDCNAIMDIDRIKFLILLK